MSARMRNVIVTSSIISKLTKLGFILLFMLTLVACGSHNIGVLNPKGVIAFEERKLFFDTLALMLIVVLPVIIMSLAFTYHYQASHRVKDYKPNWSHSYLLEVLWWGIPCVIIVALAILTWKKTYELNPAKPIAGHDQPPLLVQAIALPWKWLFIYPEQNIATVNYLVVPLGRQVEYWMTTDNVPMSALFIPQLGSQIYAMAGMRTRLHLVANEIGVFVGLNTQYNGDGFSDMNFPVHVIAAEQMQAWFDKVKQSSTALTADAYQQLLAPSIKDPPKFFSGVEPNLFQNVLMVYNNTFGPVHPRNNIQFDIEGQAEKEKKG